MSKNGESKKKSKIRNRYNQVPHMTEDITWESDIHTIRHHKREPRVSPYPAGEHKASINRRARKYSKYTGGKPRNYHEIVLTQICSQATSGTRRGSFQAENWIKKGWCHVHFCFILQLRTNNGEIRQCSSV